MRPGESFIEQPVRSLQTMLRVISEDDPTLPTVIPDGIYGPETIYAVSAFQGREGIPITGITNQITWEQIVKSYEPALIRVGKAEPIEIIMDPGKVFHRGESSPYIYLLQSMLIQLANYQTQISAPAHTGILDDETSLSLMQFQELAGLKETGELDKITWKNIVKQFTLNVHHYHNQI